MARPWPTLLALVFSFFTQCFAKFPGQHITGDIATFSACIIRCTSYFLLLNSTLYLKKLRRIHYLPESIFQFIFGWFLIEAIIVHVWFPVENAILCVILIIAQCLYRNNITAYNMNVNNNIILLASSYFLSCLILCCMLQATRAIDFRLIRTFGFTFFLDDVWQKIGKGLWKFVPTKKSSARDTKPPSCIIHNPPRKRKGKFVKGDM